MAVREALGGVALGAVGHGLDVLDLAGVVGLMMTSAGVSWGLRLTRRAWEKGAV